MYEYDERKIIDLLHDLNILIEEYRFDSIKNKHNPDRIFLENLSEEIDRLNQIGIVLLPPKSPQNPNRRFCSECGRRLTDHK